MGSTNYRWASSYLGARKRTLWIIEFHRCHNFLCIYFVGPNPKEIRDMRILDFNHCDFENCNCGWNVTISGTNLEELKLLKVFLKGKVKDETDYSEKLSTEIFNPNPSLKE